MLRKGEILTLSDNKEYTVVSTTELDGNNYVYIIEQDDYTNVMFCKFENDSLEEVIDSNLVEQLMIIFKNDLDQKN